ncbi:AMP-binding protein [Chitinophaga sp. Hz27]|uniref:AMP-binding protein n=1 Tax=Chitinophaga sp. Hz27 TaxID=3347169 RepID=UPI0035D7DFA1
MKSSLHTLTCITLIEMLLRLQHENEKGITFIKSGEQEIFVSYPQLIKKAKHCLYYLQTVVGIQAGDELIIQEEDNELLLTAFWACILGGIIPVPVSTGTKNEHKLKLLKIRDTLKNPYLFAGEEHVQRLTSYIQSETPDIDVPALLSKVIYSGTDFNLFPDTAVLHSASPDDLAFIQYSSGSTGSPKGVMLTHRNLFYNTIDLAEKMQLGPADVKLSWMPLTHDMGMICFHLTAVQAGCRQCLMPTPLFIRRPLLWMESANRHKATISYSPNFGYEYFMEAMDNKPVGNWDLSALRMIVNGAEPISADVCHRFAAKLKPQGLSHLAISPGYGMAEASVCVTLSAADAPVNEHFFQRDTLRIADNVIEESDASSQTVGFVECGTTARHCQVRVCGEKDEILAPGMIGHIQISGLNVTAGYYRNEEATKALLTNDGWVRTGDLGLIHPNGQLIITGRHKNMIILQGNNYYHHDIERLLFGIPGIAAGKVVACGIPGDSHERERLVIFVLFKGAPATFADTEEGVVSTLSDALGIVPDIVVPVREIPKTTSGKIQHFEILQRYRRGEFDEVLKTLKSLSAERFLDQWKQEQPAARLQKIENWLQLTVAALLKISPEETDLMQPLVDQGMKSLHGVQLRNLLERRLNMDLAIGVLYKYPSIDKLAGFIHNSLFPTTVITRAESTPPQANNGLLEKVAALSDEQIALLLNEN